MKSYSLTEFGRPLESRIEDTPRPDGTQVVLRVRAAGVCHTDLHVQEGGYDLGGGKRLSFLFYPTLHRRVDVGLFLRLSGEAFDDKLRFQLKFLDFAPIVHVSAMTGERTPRLLEVVDRVAAARRHRVGTSELNRFIESVTWSAYMTTRPPALRAARPAVWMSERSERRVAIMPNAYMPSITPDGVRRLSSSTR